MTAGLPYTERCVLSVLAKVRISTSVLHTDCCGETEGREGWGVGPCRTMESDDESFIRHSVCIRRFTATALPHVLFLGVEV